MPSGRSSSFGYGATKPAASLSHIAHHSQLASESAFRFPLSAFRFPLSAFRRLQSPPHPSPRRHSAAFAGNCQQSCSIDLSRRQWCVLLTFVLEVSSKPGPFQKSKGPAPRFAPSLRCSTRPPPLSTANPTNRMHVVKLVSSGLRNRCSLAVLTPVRAFASVKERSLPTSAAAAPRTKTTRAEPPHFSGGGPAD